MSKGYIYGGSNVADTVAWYGTNSNNKTSAVGSKEPNELGLYDMSGNVWEWCHDWYAKYPNTTQVNPLGPTLGSSRVLRGGSWDGDVSVCTVVFRYRGVADTQYSGFGFRVVRSQF